MNLEIELLETKTSGSAAMENSGINASSKALYPNFRGLRTKGIALQRSDRFAEYRKEQNGYRVRAIACRRHSGNYQDAYGIEESFALLLTRAPMPVFTTVTGAIL